MTHQKQYIQPKLRIQITDNVHFGDNIHDKTSKAETILFQNINGINDETNWNQVIHTMRKLNVNVFGFAEINKAMDNFPSNNGYLIFKGITT